jgi:hypothetical protein
MRVPDGKKGTLAIRGSKARMTYLVRSLVLDPSVHLTTGTFNLLSKTESAFEYPSRGLDFRLSGAFFSHPRLQSKLRPCVLENLSILPRAAVLCQL